ncbi:MAG: hypothetical protein E7380_06095 [Clostridiales bacterium]|nr:hypothetical protein [Clostridiales bacterium]MBQ2768781.1 hypothetical protein [Clostridia bacterium]
MLEFLPQNVKDGIAHLNLRYVYEIRLRAQKPVRVNYAGKYRYLGTYGLVEHPQKAVFCDVEDIDDCLFKAGKYSIYSVEEQMKKGFITGENGERIGIAGEYVFEKGQPLAVRNFTSLCIRVPHEIHGAGQEIYNSCMSDKVRSLLIMSAPGLGKTTILRDLARILCEKTGKNLLICDERGEISMGDTGWTSDVMKFSDKASAFEAGIRAMRPEIIITDELSLEDCEAVKKAVFAGVSVIASAHFSKMEYLPQAFQGIFERYVLLEEGALGCIRAIYDADGKER